MIAGLDRVERWGVPLAVLVHEAAKAATAEGSLADLPRFDPAEHESGWHRVFVEGSTDYVRLTLGPRGAKREVHREDRDGAWMRRMVEAFARYTARGFEPPADYNHSIVGGGDGAPESGKRAGSVLELRHEDHALWARVRWTEQAREYMRRGEYLYLSPTVAYDLHTAEGEDYEELLVAVALCNDPALHTIGSVTDGLAAFAAALQRGYTMADNDAGRSTITHVEHEEGMDHAAYMAKLDAVEARLASIEAVLKALQLLVEEGEGEPKPPETDEASQAAEQVQTLRQQVSTLEQQVQRYATERDQAALRMHAQQRGVAGEVLSFAETVRDKQGLDAAKKAIDLYAQRSPSDFSRVPAATGAPPPPESVARVTPDAIRAHMASRKLSGPNGYAEAAQELIAEAARKGLQVSYE